MNNIWDNPIHTALSEYMDIEDAVDHVDSEFTKDPVVAFALTQIQVARAAIIQRVGELYEKKQEASYELKEDEF